MSLLSLLVLGDRGNIALGLLGKLDPACLAFMPFLVSVFIFVNAAEAMVLLITNLTLVFPLIRLLVLFLLCLWSEDPLPDLLLGAFAFYVISLL